MRWQVPRKVVLRNAFDLEKMAGIPREKSSGIFLLA
jgi:hypothetical protein